MPSSDAWWHRLRVRPTRRVVRRAITEGMFTGQSAVMSGVVVDYGGVPERMRDTVVAKIASALRIVTRFDGRRVQRLMQDGTRILVGWPLGHSSYDADANVILVEATDVVTRPEWRIAMLIVHEAAHARLRTIRSTSANIARKERRCVEEEIAFVHRLPPVDPAWMQQFEASKRAQLDTPWWTARDSCTRLARAIAIGAPDTWYGRLLKRLV